MGDSFTNTMKQAGNAVMAADEYRNDLAVFMILVRGMEIGFFEYFNYRDELNTQGVENFEGLVPLTQPLPKGVTEDFDLFYIQQTVPMETLVSTPSLPTPCFFNFDTHETHIVQMFDYMQNHQPRDHSVSTYPILR